MLDVEVKFVPTESKKYPSFYEIPGHSRYLITRDSQRLLDKTTSKFVGQLLISVGYKVAWIINDAQEKKSLYVHRLMAFAFLGPEPTYTDDIATVNHIDGIKTNNHYTNLEWCSSIENILHAHRTGLCDGNKIPAFVQNVYTGEEIRYSSISEGSRDKTLFDNEKLQHRIRLGPDRVWPGGLRYRTEHQVFKPMSKEEIQTSIDSYKKDTICFVLDVNTNQEIEYPCLGDCAIALSLDKVTVFHRLNKGPDRVWPPGIRMRHEDEIFKELTKEEMEISLEDYFKSICVIVQDVYTNEEIKYSSTTQCAQAIGIESGTMHFRMKSGPDKVWPPGQRYKTENQVFKKLTKEEINKELSDYITKIVVYVQDVYTKEETKYISVSECSRSLDLGDETVRKRLPYGPDRVWTGGYRFRTENETFREMSKEEIEKSLESYNTNRKILVRWYNTDTVEQFDSVKETSKRFDCQRKTVSDWCDNTDQLLYGTVAEPFQIQYKDTFVSWREIPRDEESFYAELEKTHKRSIIVLSENWEWINEIYSNIAECVKVYGMPRTTLSRYLDSKGEKVFGGKRFMNELDYYKKHRRLVYM